MDNIARAMFMGSVGHGGIVLPTIGDPFEGGYYAGLISHTADGVATHALVVAPEATGASGSGGIYTQTTDYAWQSTTSVTGATSTYDGAVNTPLMVNSPAANFVTGLTIGGYSDWYLPAVYEMQIAYHHLKPTTASNNTSYGINNYSVPQRTVNNTAGNPAQTTVTAFASGGSEDFKDAFHHTSTETSSTNAYFFRFSDGQHPALSKTALLAVRAFRKVAL